MPGVSRHASSEAVEEKHPGPSPKLVVTLVMGVNHNTSSYVYPFPQLLFIYPGGKMPRGFPHFNCDKK